MNVNTTTPADTPFGPELEQPRLGIIHLMGWTACVAFQFAMVRAFSLPGTTPRFEPSVVVWIGAEIGRATALGGLVLLAVRRYRGLRFSGQPGEAFLVLLGVGVALGIVQRFAHFVVIRSPAGPVLVMQMFGLLGILLLAVMYMRAAIKTRIPRWRGFFVAAIAVYPLTYALMYLAMAAGAPGSNLGRSLTPLLIQSPELILGALLVYIAIRDARQDRSYRWTHWLGIGVGLWNGAMRLLTGAIVTWMLLSEL